MWKISYVNQLTNKREMYMRTAFPSEESALRELGVILRAKEHYDQQGVDLEKALSQFTRIPVCLMGADFKVEPLKTI